MAHEILSVKLCELEEKLSRLSSRIQLSETADHARLNNEIQSLTRECEETELSLKQKLKRSRAENVSVLSEAYSGIELIIKKAKESLNIQKKVKSPEISAEEKILLAEYALDFSIQAANRALLLAMEAMDAQAIQPKGESKSL